mgnify:CR=1 FL=1
MKPDLVLTDGYQTEFNQRKIKDLKTGDQVYLHPNNDSCSASFGWFREQTTFEEGNKQLHLAFQNYLTFKSINVKDGKLWIPETYSNDSLLFIPNEDILEGKLELYNGDIKKAMEKVKNPNYSLVQKLISGSINRYIRTSHTPLLEIYIGHNLQE